jgi:hypothetical protein
VHQVEALQVRDQLGAGLLHTTCPIGDLPSAPEKKGDLL